MNLQKMTEKVQAALMNGHDKALSQNNPETTTLHLLFALLNDEQNLASRMLELAGVGVNALRTNVEKALAALPTVSGSNQNADISPALERLFAKASALAEKMKDDYTSVEHLLL